MGKSFVGLSDYYEQEITSVSGKPIRVALAQTVSVTPGDKPLDTWVQCDSAAYATQEKTAVRNRKKAAVRNITPTSFGASMI